MKKFWERGLLRADGRYLKNGDEPFFWLGDTAWRLFHALTREEAEIYLKNRAEKGFTVIQAVAVMKEPTDNAYGDYGFAGNDPHKGPDAKSAYWDVVEHGIATAERLGLYVGLLPTWGTMVVKNGLGAADAERYGTFLAERFGKYPNIIWINGGDTRAPMAMDYWQAMGRTLKRLTPDKLISFHPFGRTLASDWFEDDDWFDIDMFQSGHRDYEQTAERGAAEGFACGDGSSYWLSEDNYKYVLRAHEKRRARPVLDGEPSYEGIPHGLHYDDMPRWNDADVRRYAYWSLLTGACGFTYGHNAIMQFYNGEDSHGAYFCREHWRDAMQHPGADSMSHVRRLFDSLPWQTGRPAQELLAEDCRSGLRLRHISAMRGDGFALAYTFTGRSVTLGAGAMGGEEAEAWWFNPLTGVMSYIAAFDPREQRTFMPPKGSYANPDWLLVVKQSR